MHKTEFEIKPYTLNSPTAISLLASTTMITMIGIFLIGFSTKTDILVRLIGVIFIQALPIASLHFLTDKAKFSTDRVILTSIFRTTTLKIESIRTFGVYKQQYKNRRSLIDPEKVGKDKFPFLMHSIFLSQSEEFDLSSIFPKKNIKLQFRRVEFDKIKYWMKNTSAQQCL